MRQYNHLQVKIYKIKRKLEIEIYNEAQSKKLGRIGKMV